MWGSRLRSVSLTAIIVDGKACAPLANLIDLRETNAPSHLEKIGNRMRHGLPQLAARNEVSLKIGGFAPLTFLSFDHLQGAALMTLCTVKILSAVFSPWWFLPDPCAHSEHVEECLEAGEAILEELGDAIRKDDSRST